MSKWSQQRKCVSHLNPIITYYIIITTNSSLDGPQYCFTYLIYPAHPPHQAQPFLWPLRFCLSLGCEHRTGSPKNQGCRTHPRCPLSLACTDHFGVFIFNISSSFCLWKVSRCCWCGCDQNNIYLLGGLGAFRAHHGNPVRSYSQDTLRV